MPVQAVKWAAACAVLLVAILAALFSATLSAELSVLSNIVALLGKLSSRSIDVRDIDPRDLQELQKKYDTVEKLLKQGSKGPSVARVQDVTFEVKKGGVAVPVRLYYPNDTALANNETRPTTVLLHGECTHNLQCYWQPTAPAPYAS
jgi:acetyl esterase/lipase